MSEPMSNKDMAYPLAALVISAPLAVVINRRLGIKGWRAFFTGYTIGNATMQIALLVRSWAR